MKRYLRPLVAAGALVAAAALGGCVAYPGYGYYGYPYGYNYAYAYPSVGVAVGGWRGPGWYRRKRLVSLMRDLRATSAPL